mgnify:CR=1 FL=1
MCARCVPRILWLGVRCLVAVLLVYPPSHPGYLPAHATQSITQIGYEPYIMMHRDYVPFYDERFRGYYW